MNERNPCCQVVTSHLRNRPIPPTGITSGAVALLSPATSQAHIKAAVVTEKFTANRVAYFGVIVHFAFERPLSCAKTIWARTLPR